MEKPKSAILLSNQLSQRCSSCHKKVCSCIAKPAKNILKASKMKKSKQENDMQVETTGQPSFMSGATFGGSSSNGMKRQMTQSSINAFESDTVKNVKDDLGFRYQNQNKTVSQDRFVQFMEILGDLCHKSFGGNLEAQKKIPILLEKAHQDFQPQKSWIDDHDENPYESFSQEQE